MNLRRQAVLAFSVMLVAAASAGSVLGQRVYSYVDENGVRVFTNIPPKNAPGVAPSQQNAVENPPGPSAVAKYDPIIRKYADQLKLDPQLVQSMIASESAFNSRAVSRKGAQGLMQLMPATASRLGVRNPFDPEENIRGGMAHLRTLLDTFNNDLTLSLAAYNAGENLVQRIKRVPNYAETRAYIKTVTSRYGRSAMKAAQPPEPGKPPLYKFIDENGFLNLTNIPPRQVEADPAAWSQATPMQR